MTEHIKTKDFNQKYPTFFKTHKRNKFNAKKIYIDNMKFDSKSEGQLYSELILQQRAGLIESVECQVKEELWAYGHNIGNYYVDFKVRHLDGKIEYIEHKSKGTETPLWRWKWKMLLAKYHNEIKREEIICSINWYNSQRLKSFIRRK
jgi:hypothetical protein